MTPRKEFQNIINNLKWCAENSEQSFSTMLANALRTGNYHLIQWMKKVTKKREIYVGRDWLQVSEQCKDAIVNNKYLNHETQL